MNKTPKISIITVSLNGASTIRDTIESILLQDYTNVEYIIIDAESSDGTVDIVRSFGNKITYFTSEEDEGIYDAMNKGIKASSGEIIGLLNSDDFYPNNFILSNVVKTFVNNNCDAVYGDLVYVSKYNKDKIVRYWQAGQFSISKVKRGWMLPHPTFFVKRSVYDKYGLYKTDLKNSADYAMILKLLYKYNIFVKYIPMILVKMRTGGKSNSSWMNRIKANKEDALAWEKNKLKRPMFIRFNKPFQKIRQFFLKPKI